MRLILQDPDTNPVVWAATRDFRWTVRISPRRNDAGLRAYYVRCADGPAFCVQARNVREFLSRLADLAGYHETALYLTRGGAPMWRGYGERKKAKRARAAKKVKAKTARQKQAEERALIMSQYDRMSGYKTERCRKIGRQIGKAESTVRRIVNMELQKRGERNEFQQ